jgi:Mrp family chromosome partitioning ATPase
MAAAGRLRLERQEVQAAQVARLGRELALPQLELPFCFSADLRPAQLAARDRCPERRRRRAGANGGPVSEACPRVTSVVVCVGPGGVGKTTTAAALALRAARAGLRPPVSSPSTRPAGWRTPWASLA